MSTTNAPAEVLAGLVERVTFHNPDTGFSVLRVKARGQRDLITVVGHAATIAAGEFVQISGTWINDRTHGLQFKAAFLKASPPTTLEGIERYLGSGMIRGIGPIYARKLVRAFGEAVFDLIEQQPERLREVTGIGPKRAARIIAGWAEQKVIREIMLFLHAQGVGTSRAVRIYKTYGNDAVQVISENPYRLARDIRGIGFLTADRIADKLGIERTALIRVRAGISYALAEAMDEGHCGLPVDELTSLTVKLIDVPAALIETALVLGAGGRRTGRRHGAGQELRVSGRPVSGRAGDRRPVGQPRFGRSALAADRCQQGDPVGRETDRAHLGREPERGAAPCRRVKSAGDHRRAWGRQDNAGQLHSESAAGQAGRGRAVRSNRASGQAAIGQHRTGGQDDPSAAGGRSQNRRLQTPRGKPAGL